LEKDGFFFSGIGPDFAADGDALRLQYLTTELDVSLLQIEKPFARELARYVASERERTKRLRTHEQNLTAGSREISSRGWQSI
jgi:hypothetical protein